MSQLIEKQAWKKLSHDFQWSEIIGRWDDVLFDEGFLERDKGAISVSELQYSRLWNKII